MLVDDGLLRRDGRHWVAARRPLRHRGAADDPGAAGRAARPARRRASAPSLERGSVVGKVFYRGAVPSSSPDGPADRVAGTCTPSSRKELDPARAIRLRRRRRLPLPPHPDPRRRLRRRCPRRRGPTCTSASPPGSSESTGDRVAEYEEILGYHLHAACSGPGRVGVPPKAWAYEAPRTSRRQDGGRSGPSTPPQPRTCSRARLSSPRAIPTGPRTCSPSDRPWLEHGEYATAISTLDRAAAAAEARSDEGLAWRARMETLDAQACRRSLEQWPRHLPLSSEPSASSSASTTTPAWRKPGLSLGMVRWIEMRAGEAAAMIERSIQYARLAGDRRIEAEGLGMLATTALVGPRAGCRGVESLRRGSWSGLRGTAKSRGGPSRVADGCWRCGGNSRRVGG